MKQFISGICRICGKDHKEVMKQNNLVEYAMLVEEDMSLITSVDKETWSAKYGYNHIKVPDKEFHQMLMKQRKKYKSMNVLAEQLRQNLARVEKCSKMYHLGIGYEWLVTINFAEDVDIKDKIEKLQKANYRYLKHGKFVVEYHTKEGNHWHIHIALKTLCNRKKNSIIVQLAKLFGVANNFVDVRRTFTDPEEYVEGIKTDSKLEYLVMDKQLRDKLGIKHLYFI